jgi:hypothetical protein
MWTETTRAHHARAGLALAAAQLGDAVLAAQAVEHYPDHILSGEMLPVARRMSRATRSPSDFWLEGLLNTEHLSHRC